MMKLLDLPDQTPLDEIDEEILEIFIEEVSEVLTEISSNFAAWKEEPSNLEALKVIRRGFHTLKGSGRLVGATVIGELGWRFENLLNRVIDGNIPITEATLVLIEQVEAVLPKMVEQFQQHQSTPYEVALLISQAHYLTESKGQSLGEFETSMGAAVTPPPKIATEVVELKGEEEEPVETDIGQQFLPESTEELEMGEEETNIGQFFQEAPSTEELEMGEFAFSEASELSTAEFEMGEEEFTFGEATEEDARSLEEFNAFDDNLAALPLTEPEKPSAEQVTLLAIFKRESGQHLSNLKTLLKAHENSPTFQVDQELVRIFHTINGSSRSVGWTAISEIVAPLENYCRVALERHVMLTKDKLTWFSKAGELMEQLLDGQAVDEEEQQTLIDYVQTATEALPTVKPVKLPLPPAEPVVPDAIDDFMSIFLDEAEEILEKTQSLVGRWQSAPHNMQLIKELQRELHTLKGGARMVGISAIGDLSHSLESVLTKIVDGGAQSNPKLQEIVQNSVDELAAMLEAVRSGVPLEIPHDLISQINGALAPATGEEEGELLPPPVAAAVKPAVSPALSGESSKPIPNELTESSATQLPGEEEDRIRVRVALIDKLTNLAGELSISRAHMEQQEAAVKNNLVEMEQTVARLRDQLRRLEIETETQIISNYQSTEVDQEEFDPLELDRFSLMQQLSRSLMESISDLVSIQDFLKILTRQTDTLLIQQTRIGAELQDVIMRTRMIPFSRISPRLQRIVRLAARELRKQVDFVINGENIEFERTVLNRMVSPLEHMLRNAVDHGIEEAATRQQMGKPPIAKIVIDIAKDGTELVIKMTDDGAGLPLAAIRKKAEEKQMIKPNTVISDQELMQFILEPSFSTAKMLTQISGRGVGMDVVNTEIKQLGGGLIIHSKTGEGTTFEVRLPLSLTINQALLVHVGEETLAVPMNNVEAVLRVPRNEVLLNNSEEMRYHKYMGNDYRIFHLGELLGFGKTASIDTPLIPVLLIRAVERRVALVVDGIEGSKEIVVKSVGPQVGAIRWITGATILGDGRVVIILDVPTLTRVDKREQVAAKVAIFKEEIKAKEKPMAKTIMVVDDSITVRKVTARLLKRQGMEVLTAKDGVDAISQLQEHTPDLMLLDVEMPRMDGYELATQVRNTPELKEVPIIMITSRTGTKHRDRAEKIGINRYLGKPFNETELIEVINTLLKEAEAHKNS